MSATARTAPRYSMNLPGTFEVHDAAGNWHGTSAEFKAAEALADHLNATDPDGDYAWTRIPTETEAWA